MDSCGQHTQKLIALGVGNLPGSGRNEQRGLLSCRCSPYASTSEPGPGEVLACWLARYRATPWKWPAGSPGPEGGASA